MEFFCNYSNRPVSTPEDNVGMRVTEQAGFVPMIDRITAMQIAGQALIAQRKAVYDFGDEQEVPEGYIDPTRTPGFDLVDAGRISDKLRESAKERKKLLAEQRAATERSERDKEFEKRLAEHLTKSGKADSEGTAEK